MHPGLTNTPPAQEVQMTEIDVAPVIEEIGVQIDLLDALGGKYAREALAHAVGHRNRRPNAPRGMHPLIARAIRDMAADEATAVRLYGPHRRVAPGQALA